MAGIDLEVVGAVLAEVHFDPNPTVDSRDPEAYAKYAEKLDKMNPLWIWKHLDEMAPGLHFEAVIRHARPVLQDKVRRCVRCDADLAEAMGCYVFYQRTGGGLGVAPNNVIICVPCRTEVGSKAMDSKAYWDMLSDCGKRRWAATIAAKYGPAPRVSVRDYIIDAFKTSPPGTFLTVAEIAVQGGDGSMGHAAITTRLCAIIEGRAEALPNIVPMGNEAGTFGARKIA